MSLVGVIFYWLKRKKEIQKKYDELLLNIHSGIPKSFLNAFNEESSEKNSKLDLKTFQSLKKGFLEFEKNKGFLQKGITAGKLAAHLGTNATYISQFMSEFKESNFNSYINKLRIEYATKKMYNDKNWRKLKIDEIASASGFNNRQSFSNIFFELNGIRPADFLKKIKEDLELQKSSDNPYNASA
ncbi:helix-turn-helix domain-containing protein [Daejeonia sp. YH14]|uniref:helix-turn-helix domain-containing protein n=1 Tax=Daejeonia sp. YH14 TaxID=3439042 RepID=UPI003F495233